MGEKLPRILPKVATFTSLLGPFTCHKFTTWDRRLYVTSEGRRAEDFFVRKSEGFGRVWTHELGYQRPARLPLDQGSITQINVKTCNFFSPYPCSEDTNMRKNRLIYVNTSLFILYTPHVYNLKEASSGNTDTYCAQGQQISAQL